MPRWKRILFIQVGGLLLLGFSLLLCWLVWRIGTAFLPLDFWKVVIVYLVWTNGIALATTTVNNMERS